MKKEKYDNPSPQMTASSISRLLWLWVFPFLRHGERKKLSLDDVYESPAELKCATVGSIVEMEWKKELVRVKSSNIPPKLWKMAWNLIRRRFKLTLMACCVNEFVIRTFDDANAGNKSDHETGQFMYACLLVLATFCYDFNSQKLYEISRVAGMKLRLGVSQLIFQKILRLRKTDSEHTNVGKLCNLLSSDVMRVESGTEPIQYVCIPPIQLVIYTFLLWRELGVASLGGLACILCIIPIQWFIGSYNIYFRRNISKGTDERGRFLKEFIGGVRLIKMYAWEQPFAAVVAKLRLDEIEFIGKHLYFKGLHASSKLISLKLIPFCALMPYIVLGNALTADKAFFALSVFNTVMESVVNYWPKSIAQLRELQVSLERIEELLLAPDHRSNLTIGSTNSRKNVNGEMRSKSKENGCGTIRAALEKPGVIMKNYSASWTDACSTLKNLTVTLQGNKLVMVIGHVGSGKSSFLNAILSELPITSASKRNSSYISVHGALSYAPQDAWILPISIRDNILFGLDMQKEKYWRVISCCGLSEDLKQFPNGDLTPVGERGISLSGGQKARVNLARAVYQDADIYLLDDPLSAVDTRVSKLLFAECFQKYLNGKLRILVTHQLQYLPFADHIIVLNREGSIWGQGSYEELKNSDVDFTSLLGANYFQKDTDQQKITKTEKAERSSDRKTKNLKLNLSSSPKEKDEIRTGAVTFHTYHRYLAAGGSYVTIAFLILSFISAQSVNSYINYWLSLWTNSLREEGGINSSSDNQTTFYASIYGGLVIGFIVLSVLRSLVFFWYSTRISINLHNSMFASLARAPTKFFDDNTSGRVMNRFTKNLNQIDETLPIAFYDSMHILLLLLGMVAVNVAANLFTIVPSILYLFFLWRIRKHYLSSSREIARHALSAKSPIFTHISTTIDGLIFTRAVRAEHRVLKEFQRIQDQHTSVHYMMYAISQWFVLYLEMSASVFLAVVAFGFLILTTSSQGGDVGVAITAILSVSAAIQWGNVILYTNPTELLPGYYIWKCKAI